MNQAGLFCGSIRRHRRSQTVDRARDKTVWRVIATTDEINTVDWRTWPGVVQVRNAVLEKTSRGNVHRRRVGENFRRIDVYNDNAIPTQGNHDSHARVDAACRQSQTMEVALFHRHVLDISVHLIELLHSELFHWNASSFAPYFLSMIDIEPSTSTHLRNISPSNITDTSANITHEQITCRPSTLDWSRSKAFRITTRPTHINNR